jgi:hypothetical protein
MYYQFSICRPDRYPEDSANSSIEQNHGGHKFSINDILTIWNSTDSIPDHIMQILKKGDIIEINSLTGFYPDNFEDTIYLVHNGEKLVTCYTEMQAVVMLCNNITERLDKIEDNLAALSSSSTS